MRALVALAFVLLASFAAFLWRQRGAILRSLAALAGLVASLRLEYRAAGYIAACYFIIELGKALGKRGA